MPPNYISHTRPFFSQCIKIRIAINIDMNAIIPRISMAIQTFTSHNLQNKHSQGILIFGIQSNHNHKYQDHSNK